MGVAASYWRKIKSGERTFDSVPTSKKEQVKILAKEDVQNGVITSNEYEQFIGEPYAE